MWDILAFLLFEGDRDYQHFTLKAEEADSWVQENAAASFADALNSSALEATMEKMEVDHVSEVVTQAGSCFFGR